MTKWLAHLTMKKMFQVEKLVSVPIVMFLDNKNMSKLTKYLT